MNDQMQKVKHHTKGINLESPLDPKQGLMLSYQKLMNTSTKDNIHGILSIYL